MPGTSPWRALSSTRSTRVMGTLSGDRIEGDAGLDEAEEKWSSDASSQY